MDDFYRDDMFHHNAYKVKIHQAIPEAGYTLKHTGILNTIGSSNIRVRVHQKNGAVAWLSPVFIKGGKNEYFIFAHTRHREGNKSLRL